MKFNDEIAHLERAGPSPSHGRGLALARAFVAHVGALSAVILAAYRTPSVRTWLFLPLSMALLVLAALAAALVDGAGRLAALAIYRHPVDLPERFRTTDDVFWGRSDPLDQSRLGEWLSRTPHVRERGRLRFRSPEAAMHCAANLDL